jgi:hypothetical protein
MRVVYLRFRLPWPVKIAIKMLTPGKKWPLEIYLPLHRLPLTLITQILAFLHRKKIASVGAANQVFVVVAKYTGTAPRASASGNFTGLV